jgi:hypothetical protein
MAEFIEVESGKKTRKVTGRNWRKRCRRVTSAMPTWLFPKLDRLSRNARCVLGFEKGWRGFRGDGHATPQSTYDE